MAKKKEPTGDVETRKSPDGTDWSLWVNNLGVS